MPKAAAATPFLIFERAVISLYDGGVLSPAVLERVIGAFAQAGVDWRSQPAARSVDGRSLHDIVTLTMLPGEPLKSAASSFMTVIEHIADDKGATPAASESPREKRKKTPEPDEDASAEELLAQLSESAQPGKRKRSGDAKPSAGSAGFNPFLNAALPHKKRD